MKERDLEKLFSDFLIGSKGYPNTSLLYEPLIHPRISEENFRRYQADLLILDTEFDNYLALIEFKSRVDKGMLNNAYAQVKTYLNILNKHELLAFLVVPSEVEDFEIFQFSVNNWIKINKEDFPRYETLQSKAHADNKGLIEDLTEQSYRETKKKKELLKGTAWSSLLSLIVGMVTAIVFSLNTLNDSARNNIKSPSSNDMSDKLIYDLSKKIDSLELQIKTIKKNDTIFKNYDQASKLNEIELKLTRFESSISKSPNRLLQLQQINFEFKELATLIAKEKEITEIKISNLEEKLDQIIIWTSGLIITIIGSIIGFAINAFRKN